MTYLKFLETENYHKSYSFQDKLAYETYDRGEYGILYIGGFRSEMMSEKPSFLKHFCEENNIGYTRFDYYAHGQSEGDFLMGSIGRWKTNALSILDQICQKPQILVGSSMGGWIMTLLTQDIPNKILGCVGIAPANDFTEKVIRPQITPEIKKQLDKNGYVLVSSEFEEEKVPITKHLIEEGHQHCHLSQKLKINVPFHILHGTADKEIPYENSLELIKSLDGGDIQLKLIKDADHYLCDDKSLSELQAELMLILGKI